MAQQQLKITDDDEGFDGDPVNHTEQLNTLRLNGLQGTGDIRLVLDIQWQQQALNDNLAEQEESWTGDSNF